MDDRDAQFIAGVSQLRDDLDAEHQRLRDLIAPSESDCGEADALSRVVNELDSLLDQLKYG